MANEIHVTKLQSVGASAGAGDPVRVAKLQGVASVGTTGGQIRVFNLQGVGSGSTGVQAQAQVVKLQGVGSVASWYDWHSDVGVLVPNQVYVWSDTIDDLVRLS